jgi:hypothetical protein
MWKSAFGSAGSQIPDGELVADQLAFVPILYRKSGVSRRQNRAVISKTGVETVVEIETVDETVKLRGRGGKPIYQAVA